MNNVAIASNQEFVMLRVLGITGFSLALLLAINSLVI